VGKWFELPAARTDADWSHPCGPRRYTWFWSVTRREYLPTMVHIVPSAYGQLPEAWLRACVAQVYCTSGTYSARSEHMGKHFATDRYLSRGGTVDAAVPPGSPALPPESRWRQSAVERDGCRRARLALGRHLRYAKKRPSLAAGTTAILVRRIAEAGTGRAKYIEQREGVYGLLRRSGLQIAFLPRIRCIQSAVGMGWLTYCTSRWHNRIAG